MAIEYNNQSSGNFQVNLLVLWEAVLNKLANSTDKTMLSSHELFNGNLLSVFLMDKLTGGWSVCQKCVATKEECPCKKYGTGSLMCSNVFFLEKL